MALVTERWYATLDDLKSELGETTTANDARLSRYIAQASRSIEDATGRTFYPVTATKYWDVQGDPYRLFMQYEDLLTLTTLSDDTGAITAANYWLYPLNASPKYQVVLDSTTLGRGFQYDEDANRAIVTTGQWGYCNDYQSLATLAADVLTTTATTIALSGATAQVGMMLLIDTEAMHVSGVSGNVATVQRGSLGTTAATHTAAAAVYRYIAPADVQMAVIVLASYTNNTRTGGGVKSESIDGYSVTYGDASGGETAFPPYVAAVVRKYQRIGL